jgi:alpha-2-macroglobulin
MGLGTRVGQGEAEVVTKKNLLVRLQAPRFFVEKDEVVLSANVHNYLKNAKPVQVALELGGNALSPMGDSTTTVTIDANGEKRVDWRVKVTHEGEAVVRMKALTDEESDAMEMKFPVFVHGMLKMESFAGVIRPNNEQASVALSVPTERRINESRLEVRYSPTLAGAMVDALPYLVDYPYGCTEQTLNRFLPSVITQNILLRMNLNLKDIQQKRTNLNAQEISDDRERAKGWKRFDRNPVFDEDEVRAMVKEGLQALTAMQLSDGGWGWFSGYGEHSWPHTTAVVVHGLQVAKQNDVALVPGMLERGIEWLRNYQNRQVQLLQNAADKKTNKDWKDSADNLDAFVYMVLVDADVANNDMLDFLYRDRTKLAVYGKAMYGLALHKQQQAEKLAMILQNIEQFLVQDGENQTAYLKLPENNWWWYWYGSDIEANAYYLKLLSKTAPKDEKASRLVKYLLNNRKHATYWNSTRDTAICIEAMAEYMVASGEDKPDMTLEVWYDGRKAKEVKIDSSNLFTFDNKFVLVGDAVESGKHTVELRKKGTGPVYFNAYLTNFTLEDFITKAGLEVKVQRKYYKLTRVDKTIKVAGSRGQAADQKVEKYERTELASDATLKSGDLVEIELEIDSKNDYEYLIFEDMKASGFEPVDLRSGYAPNALGAYMELRDEKVCFFSRVLPRGKHSVSYRMRAEIPGKFSALPTRAYAMYAPELKANSDEIKLAIED